MDSSSAHIGSGIVDPLFECVDPWFTSSFEELWNQGSRIGMERFDTAPRGHGPDEYETIDGAIARENGMGAQGKGRKYI